MGRRKKTPFEQASARQLLECFANQCSFERSGIHHTPLSAHRNGRNGTRGQRARTRSIARARQRGESPERLRCGFIDILPAEILLMIMRLLDYGSLARLAATNTAVEAYIRDLPWYRLVVEYCQGPLQIMARLREPPTTGQFNAVFADSTCSVCREVPGPWIYVLECSRCCKKCLLEEISWVENHREEAAEHFNNSDDMVLGRSIPRIKEAFSRREKACFLASHPWEKRLLLLGLSAPFPIFDKEAERVDFAKSCWACQESYHDYKFMLTQIDAIPPPDEEEYRRVFEARLQRASERVFVSTGEFLKHLHDGECRKAREFWIENGS